MIGLYLRLRRLLACPLGLHLAGNNYCAAGCGTCLRPEAIEKWRITLHDGSVVDVRAVNEVHAMNQVVFGEDACRVLHAARGRAIMRPPIRVHPKNIRSAETVGADE